MSEDEKKEPETVEDLIDLVDDMSDKDFQEWLNNATTKDKD